MQTTQTKQLNSKKKKKEQRRLKKMSYKIILEIEQYTNTNLHQGASKDWHNKFYSLYFTKTLVIGYGVGNEKE